MTQNEMKEKAEKTTKTEKTTNELETLQKKVTEQEEKINDYTNHLKRLQAEFENYCKRVEKENLKFKEFASEKIIVKLLLIIDDFERALTNIKSLPEETKKGIEIIFKNLHKIIDDEHVEPIKSVGEKVDPFKHEVILQTESDKPEDTIIEELQKGYQMNGKVIRYSKVRASKGKPKNIPNKENKEPKNNTHGGN